MEYALENNISVKQTDLLARFSELSFIQSKAARFPSLNFQGSVGYRFGRSENPTTGVLEDNNFLNAGMQLQSQVTLFNWFSQKNTIESNRLSWEADKEQTKKIQNDIALNVAVAYLQILLSKEQVNVARVQVDQTRSQLDNTLKRVRAGALPELNAAELEAQLARDSSSLITAEAAVTSFILQMKALLHLDAAQPFDVETPPIERIPIEPLSELEPGLVYASAIAMLPQQRVNLLRIQAAKKMVDVAKAGMYPTISAFGSLSTNYVNIKRPDFIPGPFGPTEAKVTVNGTDYFVEAPTFIFVGEKAIPLGTQLKNNFGQSVGIGLNVPIFNGRFARTQWERSKLTVQQEELNKQLGEQQLKQDIYTAHNEAISALQKFNADKKSVETAEKSYEFARKRYDQNLLSTFDLINSQNNLLRARIQALYSQYDFVFKMKLLEFYKGRGLRLE